MLLSQALRGHFPGFPSALWYKFSLNADRSWHEDQILAIEAWLILFDVWHTCGYKIAQEDLLGFFSF
jgi:hypothetical protein